MILDTHCHGYWHGLEHRQEEVRGNMLAAGVARSVHIGVDLPLSRKALALARSWGDNAWCAAGVHPTECQDWTIETVQKTMAELRELIEPNRDKVVAIGETGLDYYHLTRGREEAQIPVQQAFFRAHAALALELDLPLVIHTRNAAAASIDLLAGSGVRRAVIHCFSEDPAFAGRLMELSGEIYFSFSGILTYPKALSVQETARNLPLDRILVETDAPFLVPQELKEQFTINEPAFTRHTMEFLKTLRSEPGEIVEQIVWENSHRFFRLPEDGTIIS